MKQYIKPQAVTEKIEVLNRNRQEDKFRLFLENNEGEGVYRLKSITLFDVVSYRDIKKIQTQIDGMVKTESFARGISSINLRETSRIASNYMTILSEIIFRNDKYIKSVIVRRTTLNNSQVIISYEFVFSENNLHKLADAIVERDISVLVKDKKSVLNDSTFICFYSKDPLEISSKQIMCLFDILQHYIKDLVKQGYGKDNRLPVHVCCENGKGKKYQKHKKMSEYNGFKYNNSYAFNRYFGYYRMNIYSVHQDEEEEIFLPANICCDPMGIYYFLFDQIEIDALDSKMRKYYDACCKLVLIRTQKYLINKYRMLNERNTKYWKQGECILSKYYNPSNPNQIFFDSNKEIDNIKELYQQNLEYLSSIALVQNNIIILGLSIISVVVSVISIIA